MVMMGHKALSAMHHERPLAHQSSTSDREAIPTDLSRPHSMRMVPLRVLSNAAAKLTHATEYESQDKVMLSMAARVPAKGADLGALRVVASMPDTACHGNFLVVPIHNKDTATLVLDKYRTNKAYGRHIEELPGQVAKDIHESLRMWPRMYVFSVKIGKNRGNKLSNAAFSKRFHEVILRHTKYNTNINISRRAYIQEKALSNTCTFAECEDLARKMLHSVLRQRLHANGHLQTSIAS
jgi:hypothetical protein